jgi:hypothetical protein
MCVEGTGDACLRLSLEVQRRYGAEMFAVVSESPGDFVSLSTMSSVEEAREKLGL